MLTACTLYNVQLTVLWGLFRIVPYLCQWPLRNTLNVYQIWPAVRRSTLECSYRLLSTKYCNKATEQSVCCGDSVHLADVECCRIVLFEFGTIWSAGGRHFLYITVVEQSCYLFVVHVELTKAVLSLNLKSRIVFRAKCVGNAYLFSSFRLFYSMQRGKNSFFHNLGFKKLCVLPLWKCSVVAPEGVRLLLIDQHELSCASTHVYSRGVARCRYHTGITLHR
jgi:hypothetical protein